LLLQVCQGIHATDVMLVRNTIVEAKPFLCFCSWCQLSLS